MRFTPRWRKALLTAHVVTSVGWLGTDLVLLALGIGGLTGRADAGMVYPAMGYIGLVLFVPLTYLVWIIGVVSAVGTPWGLVKWWWVLVKLVITTVMMGLVTFLLYPNLADAASLGAAMPQRQRVDMIMAPSVSSTLLLVATILSTYKPWGRRRPERVERPPSVAERSRLRV